MLVVWHAIQIANNSSSKLSNTMNFRCLLDGIKDGSSELVFLKDENMSGFRFVSPAACVRTRAQCFSQ